MDLSENDEMELIKNPSKIIEFMEEETTRCLELKNKSNNEYVINGFYMTAQALNIARLMIINSMNSEFRQKHANDKLDRTL